MNINDNYMYERELREKGINFIEGVDEVGRGPLVGPVVAACVVLPEKFNLDGLTDSKKLSEKKRDFFFDEIKKQALGIGIGIIDEKKIEAAITEKTKVIIAMHYAGVACEMDTIMSIAEKYNLIVVEDAAQGVMSTYKGKALGTIGTFGCYSFHETKNYSMGEGGAIVINDPSYNERAEILREKGTNRAKFFRGQVDKYTWVDFGDSYLPSELNAAYLWAQLLKAEEINESRLEAWNYYYNELKPLAEEGVIEIPVIPKECIHNAHMFYIKCKDLEERTRFIQYMKSKELYCVFHYIPLHSAPAGIKFGRFSEEDCYTTKESERLVRLPMYYGIKSTDCKAVINGIKSFFEQ